MKIENKKTDEKEFETLIPDSGLRSFIAETIYGDDDKKFNTAIEQLEHNADVLNTISNIWKDTETEIMSSSKEFDEIINIINNCLSEAFGLKAFKMMDNQNDSSHI